MIDTKERTRRVNKLPACGFAAGDPNLGRYVGNNPTNATDPSGLFQDLARTVNEPEKTWAWDDFWARISSVIPRKADRDWVKENLRIKLPDDLEGISPADRANSELRDVHLRIGCRGLCAIRLGLYRYYDAKGKPLASLANDPLTAPGIVLFDDLEAALREQKAYRDANAKHGLREEAILIAYQAHTADMQYFFPLATAIAVGGALVKDLGPKYLDKERHVVDTKSVRNRADAYNFATAFQAPDGTILYWEYMDHTTSKPGAKVVHRKKLQLDVFAHTFYGVVEIDPHPFSPWANR
jgi:hypothetical protein